MTPFKKSEASLVQAGVDEDEGRACARERRTCVLPVWARARDQTTQRLPHLYALSPCNNASM